MAVASVKITFNLPLAEYQRLEAQALASGVTMTSILRVALVKHLDRADKRKP